MSSNIAQVIKDVSEAGYSMHHDAHFGALVDILIDKEYNLISKEGFSLFKAVLRHDLVPNVIKEILTDPVFIFCRVFGPTRQKNVILNKKNEQGIRMLTVWCWSSNSKATFYSGSHLEQLNAKSSSTSLLEVSDEALQQNDIPKHSYHIDSGGFAIVDSRCAWQMTGGHCYLFGFAIPDEAIHWFRMTFPSELQAAVTNMMDGTGITIRASFPQLTEPQRHTTTTTVITEEEQPETTSTSNTDRAPIPSGHNPSESNLDRHDGRTDDTQHK